MISSIPLLWRGGRDIRNIFLERSSAVVDVPSRKVAVNRLERLDRAIPASRNVFADRIKHEQMRSVGH